LFVIHQVWDEKLQIQGLHFSSSNIPVWALASVLPSPLAEDGWRMVGGICSDLRDGRKSVKDELQSYPKQIGALCDLLEVDARVLEVQNWP